MPEIVGAQEHDLIARPVSTLPPKESTNPGRGPAAQAAVSRWQSLMACRRSHFDRNVEASRGFLQPFCRPSESGFPMSRTRGPILHAMVAPAYRRFWNVPNTLTIKPAHTWRSAFHPD